MTGVRRFDVEGLTARALREHKGGATVSMCIPCRDEAGTIAPIVEATRRELVDRVPFLDELIVLDDRSTDGTARVAADAGATVIPIDDVHERFGAGRGKGNALWATLVVSRGDVVVWCDGDVSTFTPEWVLRLAAPLLLDHTVAIVKPDYHRPTDAGGGGRTTELVARPLLRLFRPELAELAQPLAGEYAVRRSVVEQLTMPQGWGVEIAMLLDIADAHGVGAIAEVHLGERRHRHQSLEALSAQATEVMAAVLERHDVAGLVQVPSEVRPPRALAVDLLGRA